LPLSAVEGSDSYSLTHPLASQGDFMLQGVADATTWLAIKIAP